MLRYGTQSANNQKKTDKLMTQILPRQEDFHEFEISLYYVINSKLQSKGEKRERARQGARETPQLIKCLPHKLKPLSSDPQHSEEKPGKAAETCKNSTGESQELAGHSV